MTNSRRGQGDKHRRLTQLRALARLSAQARLNEGDALRLGRSGEAAAWSDVALFLDAVAAWSRVEGLAIHASLFEDN